MLYPSISLPCLLKWSRSIDIASDVVLSYVLARHTAYFFYISHDVTTNSLLIGMGSLAPTPEPPWVGLSCECGCGLPPSVNSAPLTSAESGLVSDKVEDSLCLCLEAAGQQGMWALLYSSDLPVIELSDVAPCRAPLTCRIARYE